MTRRRAVTVAEATEIETKLFLRKVELLNTPEFIERNREALEARALGQRGMTLEEFRKQHPIPE